MDYSVGIDPVRAEVESLLDRMRVGELVDKTSERQWVDLKEEAGCRDREGSYRPDMYNAERVAEQLAHESACMANTRGGGALLVGVSDDGILLGAQSECHALRHKIYQKTGRKVTPQVEEAYVNQIRLLILYVPQSIEPVAVNGKMLWRVNDSCVPVDPTTWHENNIRNMGYDWSRDSSHVEVSAVRHQALEVARDFLRAASEARADELARATNFDFLRRLNVIADDGYLTNAGCVMFTPIQWSPLDYVRRDVSGGDSLRRSRGEGYSLIESLRDVFASFDVYNRKLHVPAGLSISQVDAVPQLAAREAIVNGVAHREWREPHPTLVEHVGSTLRVTSPGGFIAGVNETNIITHPSRSRNASLTHLFAQLKIAEREGIGVDRMVREMIRLGHESPVIREIEGPYVRTTLVGASLDVAWMQWIARINPPILGEDVSVLLTLRELLRCEWVDAAMIAPVIQLDEVDARNVLSRMRDAAIDGAPVLEPVDGVPETSAMVWRLGKAAAAALKDNYARLDLRPRALTRSSIAKSYAQHRGRISSTELASICGASSSNVGSVLKGLVDDGYLKPSSPTGRGRGFYYEWVGDQGDGK